MPGEPYTEFRIVALWTDRGAPEPWTLLVLHASDGTKAWLQLRESRRHRWVWKWTEELLGKSTTLRAPIAFRHWRDCMENLADTLRQLGYDELADDLPNLGVRSNDDGG